MSVAYEDVRILPSGELTGEFMCYAANDNECDFQNSSSASPSANACGQQVEKAGNKALNDMYEVVSDDKHKGEEPKEGVTR